MQNDPRILLICLTRRGGLLHFNDCLSEELTKLCELKAVSAANAEHAILTPNVQMETLDTGKGAKGTILKLFSPKTWLRLRKIVRDFDPDIVHIASAQEWNPALGFFIRFLLRKPLVYTLHDVIHHEGAPVYFRITEAIFQKLPEYFVVLTEQGKKILQKRGIAPGRILVVPHGVYDFFTQYRREDIAEEKEILFFGRIEEYKGLGILLDAVKPIFALYPNWKLNIVGGGDITPYQEALNHPNISITNRYVSDEEVAGFMQRCSIVALPYISASQSGVIPTAFAFEKAVVATNVGGIPDAIHDRETGLLIPPNNVRALTNALMELITDSELREKVAKGGKQFAENTLGWKAIAEKHLAFYREIIGGD